jgi:NACHT domain
MPAWLLLAAAPSPSPTTSPGAGSGSGSDIAPVLGPIGAVLVAVIAAAAALWQRRKNQKFEQQKLDFEKSKQDLEHQKIQFEKTKLEWEREKLRLQLEHEASEKQEAREREEQEQRLATEQQAAVMQARALGIEEQARRYRRSLAAELSQLKILDMTRPLDLGRVYVHVSVREQRPFGYGDSQLESVEGTREVSASRDPRTVPDQAITLSPGDALGGFTRIAILGDPGAGKTTMLRHLAFIMAEGVAPGLPDLPVYVELRNFIDSGSPDLLAYVGDQWLRRYGFAESSDYLADRLLHGRAALLLDGLDEVLGGGTAEEARNAYSRVAEEINRLATCFPEVPIAVTCRQHGWLGGLHAFTLLEALDFDQRQISKFVDNWFGRDQVKAEQLKRALAQNTRVQSLATNPLLLSLIAIVFEGDLELPERRAALYQRCVEVLLREWDARRGVRRFSRFTRDRKQDLLRELAWRYHLAGQRYFAAEDLEQAVAELLPSFAIPADASTEIIKEIAVQYGLLKAQSAGAYGFLHLTLQEYFASLAALERESGLAEVVARRHDSWWEEVLLLLAGSMSDAAPLLRAVLGLPEGGDVRSRPPDDIFSSDLLLAGRCLAASRRVSDVRLRDDLVSETIRHLSEAAFTLDRERTAQVVVEIVAESRKDHILLALLRDTDVDDGAKVSLARAMSTASLLDIAGQLVALLKKLVPLERSVRAAVIATLGWLGDGSVVPALKQELCEARSPEEKEAALVALSRLRGVTATEVLELAVGSSVSSLSFPEAVVEALVQLGDPSVGQRLSELLLTQPGRALLDNVTAVPAYLRLMGSDALPFVFKVLDDPGVGQRSRTEVAAALKESHSSRPRPEDVSRIYGVVRKDSSDWSVGWALLEFLDGYPGDPAELRRLASEAADVRIRVAAAATLAAWGFPDYLDLLVKAIIDDLVPPNLYVTGDNGTRLWQWRTWNRLAAVMVRYDGDDMARALHRKAQLLSPDSLFEPALNNWSQPSLSAVAMAIACLDGNLALDVLVAAMEKLRPSGGHNAVHSWRGLIRPIAAATTGVTASRVLALLRNLDPESAHWDQTEILCKLGDCAGVEAISTLHSLRRSGFMYGADTAHEAMYKISRRERVRVLTDGTIVMAGPGWEFPNGRRRSCR